MLGSSILDVAIGMAFIYLLLSLIASAVQEALASLVQARSANLEHGIRSLFSGGTLDGEPFVDLLYKHGLMRSLYRDPKFDNPGASEPTTETNAKGQTVRPRIERLQQLLGIRPSQLPGDISDPYLLPAYIPSRTFAITLMDLLNPDKGNGEAPLINIERRIAALCQEAQTSGKANKAAEALLALLADAATVENSAERFRANLENWYNDAMDRVSGWYKKYTQKILLCVGLILAIVFNVDSIAVGRTLWFDHDMRQGLVGAAAGFVDQNPRPQQQAAPSSEQQLRDKMENTVLAFNAISSKYLLPVGWHGTREEYLNRITHPEQWDLTRLLIQLLGWSTTAVALSFGAPFWFDTLNKFMVVRGTVKPREKSQNEVSKS
jgi:hypothetical protein